MMNMENILDTVELDQVNGGGLLDGYGLGDVFGLPFGKTAIEEQKEKVRQQKEEEEKKKKSGPNICKLSKNCHF